MLGQWKWATHPLKHYFSASTAILSGGSPKVTSWVQKYFLSSTPLIPTVISQLRYSRLHSIVTPGSHYILQSLLPTSAIPLLSSIETSRQCLSMLSISSSKSILFQKHPLAQFVENSSCCGPHLNRKNNTPVFTFTVPTATTCKLNLSFHQLQNRSLPATSLSQESAWYEDTNFVSLMSGTFCKIHFCLT